jgi:predicted N-acetyltransferase YhbS
MAVLPKLQKKGIGTQLVKTGIENCSTQGYDAPDGAFMVLELKKSSLKDKNGIIKYHPAFGSV